MAPGPLRILQTPEYRRWFGSVRDERAKGRILIRLRRLSLGNLGDLKSLGGGLHEMRIDYGPGYRVYFARRGGALVLLVSGGDKSRQKSDIARAREIALAWEPENGR
jgi:putative addiction module killer protein